MIDVPPTLPPSGVRVRVGEPVTAQLNVTAWPAVTFDGVAVKLVMVGARPAATVTVAVVDPELLVAFRVYVCVVEGVTLTHVPLTAPTPGLTVTLG